MINRKKYQASLPKKRISAGCLFFDKRKRLLVVNPTYKERWEIPGGTVEKNESPMAAVVREVKEEIGLAIKPERLLCVDFSEETDSRTESLQFIFLGPMLTSSMIKKIKLPQRELSDFRLLPPKKAIKLLNNKLGRRVGHCLSLLDSEETLYLEEQKPV